DVRTTTTAARSTTEAQPSLNPAMTASTLPVPTMWTTTEARGTAETDAAVPIAGLAVEIATRAQNGDRRFDIRLDPPELGRIDVRLDVDAKGHVTSHLVADRQDTLDLLKR